MNHPNDRSDNSEHLITVTTHREDFESKMNGLCNELVSVATNYTRQEERTCLSARLGAPEESNGYLIAVRDDVGLPVEIFFLARDLHHKIQQHFRSQQEQANQRPQRQQLAALAIQLLQQFPAAIAQRPPHEIGGSNNAYNCPIALFLSQHSPYTWSVSNMTINVETELQEDPEGVVLAGFGDNEWWQPGEAPTQCDMAQIPWLRNLLQHLADDFVERGENHFNCQQILEIINNDETAH